MARQLIAMERRVVITGIGVVTPVGCERESYWKALCEGRSGIAPVTGFDTSKARCTIGGEVLDFDYKPYFANSRDAKRADRYIGFSVAASKMAVDQAGIDFSQGNPSRSGVILGTGIGGIQTIKYGFDTIADETKGPHKISPFSLPMMIGNAAGGIVAMDLGITGPNYCVTSACATSSHAIGEAWKTILFGDADVFIAGGSESAITEIGFACFGNMRALSRRNDDPQAASRPFDKDRDGFVMGEGAAALILEELGHAKARGAEILAELRGYGASADAFHPTMPHPDGTGAAQCMTRALTHAKLNPEDIGYVNAHATSTEHGDIAETRGLKTAFGAHAKEDLIVSSTKSMTGHLLGAAGAAELAACLFALRDEVIPPTINLSEAGPECDLDYAPNEARPARGLKAALSNSFGFGGNNASLIVSRFEG